MDMTPGPCTIVQGPTNAGVLCRADERRPQDSVGMLTQSRHQRPSETDDATTREGHCATWR